jgi:thiol-disulfide isomerase/thioredoxin
MADENPEDLPVATALPSKKTAEPKAPPRSIVIDPVVIGVGAAVALIGVAVLGVFLWMVPTAAAREAQSACRGLQGLNPMDRVVGPDGRARPEMDPPVELCPGGHPCSLPVAAPDFTAVDITGKQVHLSDFKGKVVLLNFWASWCGVCKAEKPTLEAMAREMANGDFVVLTLASDKTFPDALVAIMDALAPSAQPPVRDANGTITMPAMKEAFERAFPNNIPFKIVLDPPHGDDNIGPITASWGIHAVPESALIDRRGVIRAYFVNKRDWESPVAQTCLRSVIDE